MPSLVGSKLDKYEILAEVGHGGMAVVYRGRDTVLDREVAIKVLHPHLADREESRLRLRREALTVAKLRHVNILEIFDYSGEDADEAYIVTEFIHGVTLREWLDTRWRPRPALAALVCHRLCVALASAHRMGVVHRDLKPENVMIREDGVLKLMDFGIAQIIDHQKLTMTGQLLGSPAYMAPELISGKPLDARTDLFALGIILFQLATGSLPFSGRNPHEVLTRIADADYPRPATICPLVDDELESIIDRALARDADDRYQTADAFADELARYLNEVDIPAEPKEVRAYFCDPDPYVHELDHRVCAALMRCAEAASSAGHSARAIRLLGRVLELEEDQKQARQMLSRLRTREQRLRKIAAGGVALVAVAAASAGVAFLLLSPPDPSRMAATDEGVPPREDGEIRYVLSGDRRPPKATTTDQDTDTDEPETDSGRGRPNAGTRPIDTPRPVAKAAECTLRLVDIPLQKAKNYHALMVGDRRVNITALNVPLKLTEPTTQIQLVGQGYDGLTRIDRRLCKPGVSFDLRANRKPARLHFTGLPSETSIECVKGPCPAVKKWTEQATPRLRLDEDEAEVTLVFKKTDYKTKRETFRITPGDNRLDVELETR